MVLSKKAFIILLFLANISTVSTMEIEGWRLKAAQRRTQILFNHIIYPDNDLREEIMNNITHSAFYAFLASTALMTGTARAMEPSSVIFEQKDIKRSCDMTKSGFFGHANKPLNTTRDNPENNIQKLTLRNELKQFTTQFRDKKIEPNVSNLKRYLDMLTLYKDLVINKKNKKEINVTIKCLNQQIKKLTQNDIDIIYELSQGMIIKPGAKTLHPQPIDPTTIDEIKSIKKELETLMSALSVLQAQETNNIGKDNSHYNSEENIQAQLIRKNPNQYRSSDASSINPNTARVELPIQLSDSSRMIDVLQEENENNSSNIWHSISNTLINSLASLWNSVCTIFAWFKLW